MMPDFKRQWQLGLGMLMGSAKGKRTASNGLDWRRATTNLVAQAQTCALSREIREPELGMHPAEGTVFVTKCGDSLQQLPGYTAIWAVPCNHAFISRAK